MIKNLFWKKGHTLLKQVEQLCHSEALAEESLNISQLQIRGRANDHLCDKYCKYISSLRANVESAAIQPLNEKHNNCPLTPSPSPAGRGENKNASLFKGGGPLAVVGLKRGKGSHVKNLLTYLPTYLLTPIKNVVPSKEIPPTPCLGLFGVREKRGFPAPDGFALLHPTENQPLGEGKFEKASLEKGGGAKRRRDLTNQKAAFTLAEVFSPHSVGQRRIAFTLAEVFTPYFIGYRKAAFTLAEVLITLGIIGVVASMTLPALVQKYEEKQAVTSLKKFYSSISQAYLYAKNEYGNPDIWYADNSSRQDWSDTMLDNFAQFMKTTKICHGAKGCFPDVTYKKIDGTNATNWDNSSGTSRLITSDGMSVFFYSYGSNARNDRGDSGALTETYGAISVDINGFKKPNVFGRDMFSFIVARDGIVPFGIPAATHTNTETEEVEKAFPKACNTENCWGWCEGCCAWVIYNENMDYLHCSDLSWDGKKKCR